MKFSAKLMIVAALSSFVFHFPGHAANKKQPLVQMAILLDTSGSMDGLIEQAKSQLWKVVNQFIASKKNGQRPKIQVALYEYGKDSISSKEGHIRQIVSLTGDLDKVSEELFALKTNGGNEFCGQVIQNAVNGLQWSKSSGDLKVIFIAGNEPFTQGQVDYRIACKNSISKGIIVNTIHCGSEQAGINGKWKDGAMLADGNYMFIDQNRKVPHIAAPQDQEIAKLGQKLNATYIPFGTRGRKSMARQKKQDTNAKSVSPSSMAERAVFKSSAAYSNTGWDLVDAEEKGQVKLEEMKADQLPADMKKMNTKERKKHLNTMKENRKKIQAKIQKLNQDRNKYIAKKKKEQAASGSGKDTLDSAMIKAVTTQAKTKNFQFE